MKLVNMMLMVLGIIGCASVSKPMITNEDCVYRHDCRLVVVDNSSNQYNVDLRINNHKLGNVNAYSVKTFYMYTDILNHGNCSVATARLIGSSALLESDERCINDGEYYQLMITSQPLQLWFTPFRVR